ncbi:MOSC domain-containing protein [Marinobacterium aestuariivivens]|uniref:MOSC domain-containing protein n=1 Tax=Marinobacterium aestuariivivens TaxID=1698799 RepID=A0ABW1ZV45_9GAMM
MKLSALHIYPIKSTAGIGLERAFVERAGLTFDRRFVVADATGGFMTARRHPRLLQVRATPTADGLWLSAPEMPDLRLRYGQFPPQYRSISVWRDHIDSQQCGDEADRWFSDYLGQDCRLQFFGPRSQRETDRLPHSPVAFADGYPLLLISEGSLEDLNRRCPEPVSMARFRPNLVVSGTAPFAEDGWTRIRIGALELALVKPCSRCVMTTLDPASAERHPRQEPLRTLSGYRRDADGQVNFGQNLVPLGEGVLEVGMEVEILE